MSAARPALAARAAAATLAASLLALPAPAAGQAWLDWDVAARPMGMGGAAAALDDAASAVWYDPAGIASFVGTRVSASGALSLHSGELVAVGGGGSDRDVDALADPSVFLVHPISRDLVGGLAVVSPWGIATSWSDPNAFIGRFQAYHTRLRSVEVSPVLAWRARPDLSLAAGVHVAWARLEIDRIAQDPDLSALGGLGPIALARAEMDMDGTGIGWMLGAHWRPRADLAVGAHARSGVTLNLNGPVDFTGMAPASLRSLRLPGSETTIGEQLDATYVDQAARTGFELPAVAAAGVAWDAIDRLRLAATVQWADWSAAETLALAFTDSTLADVTPLGYEDAWALRVGVEVRHSPALLVRLGFAHEASPAPTGGVGPLVPDADRNALSAGLGAVWSGLQVDVAYRIAFLKDRGGVLFPGSEDLAGEYGATEHRFAIGVSRDL